MVDAVRDPSPILSAEERANIAALARDLPALQEQVQELELLLQQNVLDVQSQRERNSAAKDDLRRLEQGGGFTREQYQQLMLQAQQSELRYITTQHQQELLQSKRETVHRLVDVAGFTLQLARRIDPASTEAPPPAAPVAPRPAPVAEPLPSTPMVAPSDSAM